MSWDHRKTYLETIEKARKSRALLYVTGDRQNQETIIGNDVFDLFVEQLDEIGVTKRISLILHTRGGDGMTAWSLANLVRMFCDELEIIIPEKAHSAGTMIAMAANKIVMTKQATIGPIDPSINHPLAPSIAGAPASARAQVSVEAVQGYIDLAKSVVGSDNREAFASIMLELAKHVHPLVLGESFRRRQQTRNLAERLLAPNVKKPADRKKIIEFLSSDSGSHDYTLNRREAASLGLAIEKCPADLYPTISELYANYRDEMQLREPFIVQRFPKDATTPYRNVRAMIESTAKASHFISEGQAVRQTGVQTAPNGPPVPDVNKLEMLFEGWRTP
ncbi:MAG: serine protease [Pseudomonadota bacterium]|nr:serine protease [Pseudomonadota bacterium]